MNSSKLTKKFAIISGPTATGKSSIAYEYALANNLHIINFDSLLFYHGLNIGTAKPSSEELNNVPHHLVDCSPLTEEYNAATFVKECLKLFETIDQRFLLVGGSGFYLKALLYGMYEDQSTDQVIKHKSDKIYSSHGILPFLEELKTIDPEAFNSLHENDHYRIRRAVEYFWQNKKPFSSNKKNFENQVPFFKNQNWDFIHLHFDIEKSQHFKQVKKRTRHMLQSGLVTEVETLLKATKDESLPKCLRSIGYKEVYEFLQSSTMSLAELEELINIHTRQLAKAQRTFFKFFKNKQTFNPLTDKVEIQSVLDSHLVYND